MDRCEKLRGMFYYDEESPSCLRWKIEIRSGRNKAKINVKQGDVAGGFSSSAGYYSVRVDGRLTLVHRVIWEMLKGEIPEGLFIDHINQNKTDNRIENLRVVTKAGNNRNQKLRKDNSSGAVGVHLLTNRYKNGNTKQYWRASWFEDNKAKRKSFSY